MKFIVTFELQLLRKFALQNNALLLRMFFGSDCVITSKNFVITHELAYKTRYQQLIGPESHIFYSNAEDNISLI